MYKSASNGKSPSMSVWRQLMLIVTAEPNIRKQPGSGLLYVHVDNGGEISCKWSCAKASMRKSRNLLAISLAYTFVLLLGFLYWNFYVWWKCSQRPAQVTHNAQNRAHNEKKMRIPQCINLLQMANCRRRLHIGHSCWLSPRNPTNVPHALVQIAVCKLPIALCVSAFIASITSCKLRIAYCKLYIASCKNLSHLNYT